MWQDLGDNYYKKGTRVIWTLFILISYNNYSEIESIRFESKEACIVVGKSFSKRFNKPNDFHVVRDIETHCVGSDK